MSDADRLRSEFVWKMESDALAARLAMMPATHVLKHVPRRIGQSQALDDAVACISQSQGTSKLYVVALESLRAALDNHSVDHTSEKLLAASLLQMYEQYTDHSGRRWVHHARGVIKMLQVRLRGPGEINDEAEMSVLGAQAADVFMSALIFRDDCFLASPAWYLGLRPSRSPESRLDVFVRTILSSDSAADVDDLLSKLMGTCRYGGGITEAQRKRLTEVSIADFLRIRTVLEQRLVYSIVSFDMASTNESNAAANLVAIEFFTIVMNTVVLNMSKQLADLCHGRSCPLINDRLLRSLKAERSTTLKTIQQHFMALNILNPEVCSTIPTALRAILETILDLGGPSESEVTTILLVLDQELEVG